jgi:hypothetical protein
MMPGIAQLVEDIKVLEDLVRSYQRKEEVRMMFITSEEADVIESYRRFKAEEL